jgi:hypothetical protein
MAVTLYQQGGKGKTRRYQKVNLGRGRRRPISPVPTSCGTRSPTAPVHGSGWRRPRLKNTGDHEGAEIVELYVGDAHAGVPRPVKELKGFARVNLKPQETRRVFIALDRRSFAFYDVNRKDWNAEESDYSLLIGSSSDDIQLRGNFTKAHQQR